MDTDIVIEVLRGNEIVIQKIKNLPIDTIITITGLTVYELYKGTYIMGDRQKEQEVMDFIELVDVLQLNTAVEKKAGEVYANLKKRGEQINDADILIAAIVLKNNGVLITNNTKHFKRIENLKIENWMQ
ncbi:MAG: PIN domain-containing protein [Methanosarcinales archaeon]|nr:PIN domain-containing protein [Methanosarcinales archaeon]